MRRLILLSLLLAVCAVAQNPATPLPTTATNPNGQACQANTVLNYVPSGVIYTCQNGTMAVATGLTNYSTISGLTGYPSTFPPTNSGDWAGTWGTHATSYFQPALTNYSTISGLTGYPSTFPGPWQRSVGGVISPTVPTDSVSVGTTVVDPVNGITAVPAITVTPDGVHAQINSLVGNTANPAVPANSFGWLAPLSAAFTSYFLQPTTTAPSGNYLQCAAPSLGVSACTWATPTVTSPSINVQQPLGGIGNGLPYSTFQGKTWGSGFVAPNSGVYGHVSYAVDTADNTSHQYNMGIYNAAGTLLCSTGSIPGTTFSPATGPVTLAFTSNCTLTQGSVYFLAYTPITAATAQLAAVANLSVTPFAFAQVSASMLPSTITAPTLAYTASQGSNMIWFSLMP